MDIKATVKEAIKRSGKTEAYIAELAGLSRQVMTRRINADSLSARQFLDILEACGAEARICMKETGEEVWARDLSEGRYVRRMVGGIIYDTSHSVALGNNFDKHEEPLREAYRDEDGHYFFAEYRREGDMIVPSNGLEVAEFLKNCKQGS